MDQEISDIMIIKNNDQWEALLQLAWIWTSRGTGLTLGLKLKSPVSPTPNQSAKSLD